MMRAPAGKRTWLFFKVDKRLLYPSDNPYQAFKKRQKVALYTQLYTNHYDPYLQGKGNQTADRILSVQY